MSFSSEFIVLIFINFSASFSICVFGSVWLLSTGKIEFLGPVKIPVKIAFTIGAIIGLLHTFIYGFLIFYYTPVSILDNSLLNFAATALTVFVLLVRFAVVYFVKNKIVPSLVNVIQALYIGIMMLFSALLLFLIPSLIFGALNKIVCDFVI